MSAEPAERQSTAPVPTSAVVNTVTGTVPVTELGTTLVHEHVFFGMDGVHLDARRAVDEADTCARAVDQLRRAAALGLRTMVDATPIEMYRRPLLLRRVAEAAGVQIVCATGLYTASHGVPGYFRHMATEQLRDHFAGEITDGIGHTGIRAGVLKVATSPGGIVPVEEKILTAAAGAQLATGVPIVTHTSGSSGVEQLEVLLRAGVDPGRVVVGHLDHRRTPIATFLRILRLGAYVGLDRVGRDVFLPDSFRAGLVAAMVREGFESRICLSMDSAVSYVGEDNSLVDGAAPAYTEVLDGFRSTLAQFGVGGDVVDRILTDNPRRLFTPTGAE
ncbi:phosphotriesterase-related protein [Nakamurella sp. YIM 132087]|uniref:Phosphotriesterase-related protein n=1 Tax=Nakamurella alba TaxID=2665158 RepID=A0A7K1FMN4_9ACTN|nr:phosphotriesterase-related protein [Nakamurella alba]MTD14044.1 phosphotriesterase-related protein [Nakamurella alba]